MKTVKHIKNTTVRRALLVCFSALIVLNLCFMGVSFAKYVSSIENDGSGDTAKFDPVIDVGQEWTATETFSQAGLSNASRLGGTVRNGGNTPITAYVTLEGDGILPLDFEVYACAKTEIDSATPLTKDDSLSTENISVYAIALDPSEQSDFAISVKWQDGAYDERFNGLTETVRITVVCEQNQLGGTN